MMKPLRIDARQMVVALAVCIFGCLSGSAWVRSLHAQEVSGQHLLPTQLAATVIQTRREWLDHSTSIDRCSLLALMADPTDLPSGFPPGLRPVLEPKDSTQSTCRAVGQQANPPGRGGYPHRVQFDSVTFTDSITVVSLTVFRGENIHRESYRTMRLPDGRWAVHSVTISGMVRVH